MTNEELLDDLSERLIRASTNLREYRELERTELERKRLAGKIQGVELALDYLRAYR